MKNQTSRLQGIISISSKGTGYVAIGDNKIKKIGEDPEVDFKHLNTALHGDTVEIILHPKIKGKPDSTKATSWRRQTAEVSRIISRAKTRFAGVLQNEDVIFFLKPDDSRMYADILIPPEMLHGAKPGQKVFAEIVSWTDPRKAPEGKILKILGAPGENDAEMHAIAMEKGFDSDLPKKVEAEAEKIKHRGIQASDLKGRRDFRGILTFTIDPEDAKDFDDAISFREISDGYEVGIHIADVSHYVRPGSALDREARERGTSVYLVDRTIPMLPEALSNDLCSLVPGEDRLTMSAVFIVDKNGRVKSEWFGETVIRSKKRFTYEEAEESIKKAERPFHHELATLNRLAKKMTEDRFARGAISLEQEEVKFVLDKSGKPIKVIIKERGDSSRMIEEFMLLANKKVAELLAGAKTRHLEKRKGGLSIYRVHDLPSREKMADLLLFLRSLGHELSSKGGIIPAAEINKLLRSLSGKNEKDTVHRAVIRSMAKAVYSTKNIGHFGLAFPHYTHFTSPIRRYPDIIIHRLLRGHLSGKKIKTERELLRLGELEEISRLASEQEKRAADAERASIKYKQVEYMSGQKGKDFEGIISGITEWGIYVEEMETKCEGMIRIRDLADDFYIFNEKKLELVGQKKKKKYRFGDRIKIKVKGVDLERKTIDYILA